MTTAREGSGHVHEWGEWKRALTRKMTEYALCSCGASRARGAELEAPQAPACVLAEPSCDGSCGTTPLCGNCEGPHATGDCQGAEGPEEDAETPPGERCTCGATACESELCDCDSAPCPVDHAAEFSSPAQPDRRPPYAVAYSVGGQLFETFLPGDATATAVDGALIIRHDGPVLAIVSVKPIYEGSADGA